MYIVIIILSFFFSHYLYNAAFDSILIKKLMMMMITLISRTFATTPIDSTESRPNTVLVPNSFNITRRHQRA